MNSGRLDPEKVLKPHVEATYNRVEQVDFALVVQDTTELDPTRRLLDKLGDLLLSSESLAPRNFEGHGPI